MKHLQIRQGDVQLQAVNSLPQGCVEVPPEGPRIVLAHGEVTGHAHAIYDHTDETLVDKALSEGAVDEMAAATIARAQAKARLYTAPDGVRYLEVMAPVTLRHEEHTAHTLPPGIYKLPVQVEYTPSAVPHRVLD